MTLAPHKVQALEALARLGLEADAEDVSADVKALLERLNEGRVFVACLGQFKRGKSTLINALVGEPLLPAGVAPVTSVVTVVRYGEKRARVRSSDGEWQWIASEEIDEYVSEGRNPQNAKHVSIVEAFCPSPLLESGLCLVDTPGVGSVFGANTEETRTFLPQVDAALVVLGGDPPISADELEVLEAVAGRVRDVLVVLNKADRLREQDRREAVAFTRKVLGERLPAIDGPIFEVSAAERLDGEGPARDFPALVARLTELAGADGGAIVERAFAARLSALVARLRQWIGEQRDALLRPAEATERRISTLRRCAATAELSLVELTYRFDAQQQALERRLRDERKRFQEAAHPKVMALLDAKLTDTTVSPWVIRPLAFDAVQDDVERAVRDWFSHQRPLLETEFAGVTARFAAEANVFLEELAASGQFPAGTLPLALGGEFGLRATARLSRVDATA